MAARITLLGFPAQAHVAGAASAGCCSQSCKLVGFSGRFGEKLSAKAVRRARIIYGLTSPGCNRASAYGNITATKELQILSSEKSYLDHFQFKHADLEAAGSSSETILYSDCKGWKEDSVKEAALMARLHLVAAMASDRSQIHANLGSQRDNWNKLFQGTLRLTTISAAMLSALNGGPAGCLNLSLAAALLNLGSAGMMLVINQFQPSQLAEEQRTAARLFAQLEKDINATLNIHKMLREDFATYLNTTVDRLHSLDKAYPLPLTPGGLEKFPKVVTPPQLSTPVDESLPEVPIHCNSINGASSSINGWTPDLVSDLKKTSQMIRTADIPTYLSWAQTVVTLNKILATAAPSLAAAAGAVNILGSLGLHFQQVSPLAATCFSILSMFSSSFSHDMQLGMIFELYRNSAGYFADMDASIQRAIRTPVEKREDGALFHERVALMLGRRDQTPIVSAKDKTAGTLF